jgi:glycosyltransferase involved in cell wall biosynthesis
MTPLRLTVITPSLNQDSYLERAIRSVLDQGYPNLEYIVMDGGSTDGSVEILRAYDDRLAYWTSAPDAGQSWAINRAIERSSGDVIAYINSDDFYEPGAFAAALPLFADRSVRWVVGDCEYRRADGTVETVWKPRLPRGPRPGWVRTMWYVPQASSFWRRDVFEEVGPLRDDLHYVFDTEFGLRLALAGVLPTMVGAQLAVRYVHDEAKSAEPARFTSEWATAKESFDAEFGRREVVADSVVQLKEAVARFQYRLRDRLGLLDLRERWLSRA